MNHAAAAIEPVTPRNVRRLSPGLVAAAAIAILAVVVVVWKTNRHSESAPIAAAPSASAPVASNSAASSAPGLATVYLRLEEGEKVLLNGETKDVKPASSGFASLNLAAGKYRIEVQNGSQVLSQTLTIDKPGTWLINPGKP